MQVGARFISPASLQKKCIPDEDFLFGRSSASLEAPFEDFLVRSALQGSLDKLIVIYSEKSCATCIEKRGILNADKISRRQSALAVRQTDHGRGPFAKPGSEALDPQEEKLVRGFQLLTRKPLLVVYNQGEAGAPAPSASEKSRPRSSGMLIVLK